LSVVFSFSWDCAKSFLRVSHFSVELSSSARALSAARRKDPTLSLSASRAAEALGAPTTNDTRTAITVTDRGVTTSRFLRMLYNMSHTDRTTGSRVTSADHGTFVSEPCIRHQRRSQGFRHQSGGQENCGVGDAVGVLRGSGALVVNVATARGGTYSPYVG
jgi:hypothetical protein